MLCQSWSELGSKDWRSPDWLWGGLDKSRHIIPTTLLVQCFRKDLYKAVDGQNKDISSSRWSLCHTFEFDGVKLFSSPTRLNSLRIWPSLVCSLDQRRRMGEKFLQKHILETIFHLTWTKDDLKNLPNVFEACDICNPVSEIWKRFADF